MRLIMLKFIQLSMLCFFLASCHQSSSYVSRYGQSIVLNPNQTQTTLDKVETISDQKLGSLVKPKLKLTKTVKVSSKKLINDNINFSSTKFLKGNADCIEIIRVKVGGSLSYDELMNELKKRAHTMGGNAIGISDLKEKKEITFTNQRRAKKNSKELVNTLVKETSLLSYVTADIFKCNSKI